VIQKKICLLGASGVGKTSLVRRFVDSLFDEHYLTTIGVKVDKRQVQLRDEAITLMLWDIAGAEEHFSIPSAYVRGAAGYLLVVDATRPETMATARELTLQVARDVGTIPCVLVVNKIDLPHTAIDPGAEDVRALNAGAVLRTSAKTGEGVEDAFNSLAALVLD
jgi:small GTP-binding protein